MGTEGEVPGSGAEGAVALRRVCRFLEVVKPTTRMPRQGEPLAFDMEWYHGYKIGNTLQVYRDVVRNSFVTLSQYAWVLAYGLRPKLVHMNLRSTEIDIDFVIDVMAHQDRQGFLVSAEAFARLPRLWDHPRWNSFLAAKTVSRFPWVVVPQAGSCPACQDPASVTVWV